MNKTSILFHTQTKHNINAFFTRQNNNFLKIWCKWVGALIITQYQIKLSFTMKIHCRIQKYKSMYLTPNGIKVQVFSKKHIENKHLCCHHMNYYSFCYPDHPGTNLIAGSTNMIEIFKKNMSFYKIR